MGCAASLNRLSPPSFGCVVVLYSLLMHSEVRCALCDFTTTKHTPGEYCTVHERGVHCHIRKCTVTSLLSLCSDITVCNNPFPCLHCLLSMNCDITFLIFLFCHITVWHHYVCYSCAVTSLWLLPTRCCITVFIVPVLWFPRVKYQWDVISLCAFSKICYVLYWLFL